MLTINSTIISGAGAIPTLAPLLTISKPPALSRTTWRRSWKSHALVAWFAALARRLSLPGNLVMLGRSPP